MSKLKDPRQTKVNGELSELSIFRKVKDQRISHDSRLTKSRISHNGIFI